LIGVPFRETAQFGFKQLGIFMGFLMFELQDSIYFCEKLFNAFCQSMFRAICRSSPIANSHLTQNGIAPQVLTVRRPILELIAFDQIEGGRSF
jgi:hypothetical protein